MRLNEKRVMDDFFNSLDTDQAEAYLKVWEKSNIDFDDFIQRPSDFADPSTGSVTGLIYYSDTKPLGKKILAFALKKAAEYDFKSSFFIEMEGEGEDIDYNKVSWFVYECFYHDFIDFIENLKA